MGTLYVLDPNPLSQAKCKHCGSMIRYNNGTSVMLAHVEIRERKSNNVGKKQKSNSSAMGILSPSFTMIDQEACQIALVKLFVALEFSFRMVEHKAFRESLSIVAPFLFFISRTTMAQDVLKLWSSEK